MGTGERVNVITSGQLERIRGQVNASRRGDARLLVNGEQPNPPNTSSQAKDTARAASGQQAELLGRAELSAARAAKWRDAQARASARRAAPARWCSGTGCRGWRFRGLLYPCRGGGECPECRWKWAASSWACAVGGEFGWRFRNDGHHALRSACQQRCRPRLQRALAGRHGQPGARGRRPASGRGSSPRRGGHGVEAGWPAACCLTLPLVHACVRARMPRLLALPSAAA
jgi:hypothetical protein